MDFKKIEMKYISFLDPSLVSYNLGNDIIFEEISNSLSCELGHYFQIRLQFTDKLGKRSKQFIKNSEFVILAGTNSLSSKMASLEQFRVNIFDTSYLNNIVLCGVGWWQYENFPKLLSRKIIQSMLHTNYLHSVRDSYTQDILHSIGIENVLNTSCPTLWNITDEHCKSIERSKSKNVLFTLTDYSKDRIKDKDLINILKENYECLYFWPQGLGDYGYLQNLLSEEITKINIINPSLSGLDKFLKDFKCDYIGTRLHGGIRAIKHGKRTLILSIDNRAHEISRDVNLNCIPRERLDDIEDFIYSDFKTELSLPRENISAWKKQF